MGYAFHFTVPPGQPANVAGAGQPAGAGANRCLASFVFLTSSDDAADLRDHAAVHFLRSVCDVEIRIIDDLITGDNYSTTITLAYARAVRAAGDAMLDTCFFFMISDYIMADGSLRQCAGEDEGRIQRRRCRQFPGCRRKRAGILLQGALTPAGRKWLSMPRKLMRWALDHLHPMTLANMVNFPLSHSVHSNRLFWRVDENTLIGRFYLMHMVCIRPELTDFVVGSSCDYSFIPEMCPSGKVYAMTDSDDYLVVEMQKRGHERNFVRLGAVNQPILTESLAEWATATHRKNAHSAVVFHAADLSPVLDKVVAESGAYIDEIERLLPKPPPHRNHPYWMGAMAAYEWAVAQRQNAARPRTAADMLQSRATGFNWWLYRFRNAVFGRPPQVKSWHPRWPDYRMFMALAQRHFSGNAGSLLIISNAPAAFGNFLSDVSQSVVSLDLSRFLTLNREQFKPLMGSFEGCLLVLGDAHINRARDLIRRIKVLLPRDRTLLVFAINGQGAELGPWFSGDMLHDVGQFFDHDMPIEEVVFVPAGLVPWIALRGMQNAFALVQKNWLWMSVESLIVGVLTIVSFLCNLGRRTSSDPPYNQSCSSVGLVMRKTGARSLELEIIEEKQLYLPAQRFLWDWARPADEDYAKPPEEVAVKR